MECLGSCDLAGCDDGLTDWTRSVKSKLEGGRGSAHDVAVGRDGQADRRADDFTQRPRGVVHISLRFCNLSLKRASRFATLKK